MNNAGTIEPLSGTLVLSGALQNGAQGLIQPEAGSQITVLLGLATNLGTISLTGGIFDNNGFALTALSDLFMSSQGQCHEASGQLRDFSGERPAGGDRR